MSFTDRQKTGRIDGSRKDIMSSASTMAVEDEDDDTSIDDDEETP